MPKIEVNEKLFFKMVGKTYDYDTLEKKMTSAKAELDEKPDVSFLNFLSSSGLFMLIFLSFFINTLLYFY